MITRIEISGFKSFTDFAVDLAPLSIIAGANASGKSNFLDALQVIQGLATGRKFGEILDKRGQASDLFTKYTADERASEIRIAVELLTPAFYEGRADKKIELKGTRFRYEIALEDPSSNEDYFELFEENLKYIAEEEDVWVKPYLNQQGLVLRYPEKVSDNLINRGKETVVSKEEGVVKFTNFGDRYEQTFLSIANGDEDVHLLAVRQVFENLFVVNLASPENFSNFSARKSNNIILKELKEIATKQPEDYSSINFQRTKGIDYLSLRVRQIAKNISKVNAGVDPFGRLSVFAENQEGARFLSDSLSEGTLRAIALSSLLVSKAKHRTYLFEEPENGVDPRVLKKMAQLLMDIATDFSEENQPHNQIICTTHSPILLDLVVNAKEARHATAYLTSIVSGTASFKGRTIRTKATHINEIVPNIDAPVADSRLQHYTLHQAKEYINTGQSKTLTSV